MASGQQEHGGLGHDHKMTDLTRKLVEASNGMLTLSPEETDTRYSRFDGGAVEVETGEFLYGLMRLLKPEHVLTTGVYTGVSDMYIGKGIVDNGMGRSTALEFEKSHLDRAQTLWRLTGVGDVINGIHTSSLDFDLYWPVDFLFLDTEPNIRFQEVVKFYKNLLPGGFILLHDLPYGWCQGNVNSDHPEISSWPWGNVPDELKSLLHSDKLRAWNFPSPRGMAGLYKPRKDDYRP